MKTSKEFQKKFIYFSVIFLAVIFTTGGLNYFGVKVKFREESTTANMALLQQICENVDRVLLNIDSQILNFMHSPLTTQYMDGSWRSNSERFYDLSQLQDSIGVLKNTNSDIDSVYVYSIQKAMVLTDDSHLRIQDFHDIQWIDELKNMNEMYVYLNTRPVNIGGTDSTNEKNIISLMREYPVTNYKSQIKGAVLANMNETDLYKIISKNQKTTLSSTFIISEDGVVISHKDKSKIGTNVENEPYLSSAFSSQGSGYDIIKIDGKDFYVFYTSSSYTKWRFVSLIPMVQMNKSFQVLSIMLLIVTAVMCLIAAALLFYFAKYSLFPMAGVVGNLLQKMGNNNGTENNKLSNMTQNIENWVSQIVINNQEMQEQLEGYVPIIKSRIIMDILTGNCTEYERMLDNLTLLGIDLYHGGYSAFVIDIQNDDFLHTHTDGDVQQFFTALLNKTEELFNEETKGAAIHLNNHRVAALVSFEQTNANQNMMVVLSILPLLENFILDYNSISFTIGVGSVKDTIGDAYISYLEAEEALTYEIFFEKNTTISIEDINVPDENSFYQVTAMSNNVVSFLKKGDIDSVVQMIDEIYQDAVRKGFSPSMMHQLNMFFILQGIKTLNEFDIDIENEKITKNALYDFGARYESIEEMKSAITNVFIGFHEMLNEKKANKSYSQQNVELINAVVEYIQQNYMKSDISLGMIASKYKISTSHLSKLFKETLDMNFIDYLIYVRLERAKELLENSSMKINQISEEVGYYNIPSFIRIFKKYTNQTPSEYRRKSSLK